MNEIDTQSEALRATLAKKVKELPLRPGVYQFYDAAGKLLYIGKATSLRSRVSSYFRGSTDLSDAKRFMVHQIVDVRTIVVDSEPEALLLETTLIKKHKPPYNVVMKDDKNFQYIHITDELYPRIEVVRRTDARSGRYFGPYISGRAVWRTLHLLKSLFRYCEQAPVVKNGQTVFPKRPCLDYHLGRCVGPCANALPPEEYALIFKKIEEFLKGDYEAIQTQVEREMKAAAKQEQFEKAARLRDQMQAIEQMMVQQKVVSSRRENADYMSLARFKAQAAVNVFTVRKGHMIHQEVFFLQNTKGQADQDILEDFCDQYYAYTVTRPPDTYLSAQVRRGRHRKLLEMGIANAEQALHLRALSLDKRERRAQAGLEELAAALKMTPEQLHRVEIYDISNIQGNFSVGSMVVFINGQSEKSQYRKFKIKRVQGPNDFASHQEVLDRRLQHLPERIKDGGKAWPTPSLIIIDGGKGQLSAAKAVIDAYALDIPIIGLAKREEEIFIPGSSEPILLPKDSAGLHLIQQMRDEAHRFAIGFYRRRHLKGLL